MTYKNALYVCMILMICTLTLKAQTNQGFHYQAVARDNGGGILSNTSVRLRFQIKAGSPSGSLAYQEIHHITTNEFGLINLSIGKGTPEGGNFDQINWAASPHYLIVELNGNPIDTTLFSAVPYSKVATEMSMKDLKDVTGTPSTGKVLKWNGNAWTASSDEVNDTDSSPTNEIQTLSLNGSSLSLSLGGGSLTLPGSPWRKTGNNTYFNTGKVGIGLNNPSHALHLKGSTGNLFRIEHTASGSSFDLIEMEVSSAFTGQFLELQKAGVAVARVNADGGAEFQHVTVKEKLANTASPTIGRVYADNLPLAYGFIGSSGGIFTEFGVQSVNKTSTGIYEIVTNKSWTGSPVIIATVTSAGPTSRVISAAGLGSNRIRVNVRGGDNSFYFVIYGNPQ